MASLKLDYPVWTPDGRELFPAGAILTPEIMKELASPGKGSPRSLTYLLEQGSIREDLLHFLAQPPYREIFSNVHRNRLLFGLLEKVRVAAPILGCFEFFRNHEFYTYRHTLVVFALSALIAQDLIDDSQQVLEEASSGPSHDVGKICVPLPVLRKSDPLTRTERGQLEHHVAAGYVLLAHYHGDSEDLAARVARDHHERKDGSGYPLEISLEDRLVEIVAASDIYDALISARPYRPTSYDNRTALEELTAMAARNALSWDVVQALVALNRKGQPHYSSCTVSTEKRGTPPADNRYGIVVPDNADHRDEWKQ